jgi:hypothetical protein
VLVSCQAADSAVLCVTLVVVMFELLVWYALLQRVALNRNRQRKKHCRLLFGQDRRTSPLTFDKAFVVGHC